MEGVVFSGFFFVMFLLLVPAQILWIFMLIEVCKTPDPQYRAAGTEKVTWIVVVAVAGIIGALVWFFAKRKEVLAAVGPAAVLPVPAAGWYLEPDGRTLRWWDGVMWTEHRSQSPGGSSLN